MLDSNLKYVDSIYRILSGNCGKVMGNNTACNGIYFRSANCSYLFYFCIKVNFLNYRLSILYLRFLWQDFYL